MTGHSRDTVLGVQVALERAIGFEPSRVKRRLVFGTALLAFLCMTGCDKPSDTAKREYDMLVRARASGEQRCAKKKEIAQALLKEGNQHEFTMADIDASLVCNRVLLDSLD